MKRRIWISACLLVTLAEVSGCRKHAETAKGDPLLLVPRGCDTRRPFEPLEPDACSAFAE